MKRVRTGDPATREDTIVRPMRDLLSVARGAGE
jgi:hypothetical protein